MREPRSLEPLAVPVPCVGESVEGGSGFIGFPDPVIHLVLLLECLDERRLHLLDENLRGFTVDEIDPGVAVLEIRRHLHEVFQAPSLPLGLMGSMNRAGRHGDPFKLRAGGGVRVHVHVGIDPREYVGRASQETTKGIDLHELR